MLHMSCAISRPVDILFGLICRFLYHEESPEYKYYEAHLQQAEASKSGSTDRAPPHAPPLPPGKTIPEVSIAKPLLSCRLN